MKKRQLNESELRLGVSNWPHENDICLKGPESANGLHCACWLDDEPCCYCSEEGPCSSIEDT